MFKVLFPNLNHPLLFIILYLLLKLRELKHFPDVSWNVSNSNNKETMIKTYES